MSWEWLWAIVFAVAFGSSTLISIVIAVRGWDEIRELFAILQAPGGEAPPREQVHR